MTINQLCKSAHEAALASGWYESGERNFGELLMLIVSELGECLEAHRKDRTAHGYRIARWASDVIDFDYDFDTPSFEKNIKDTVEDELADAVIRIADMAAYLNIDLESHILAKMKYNETRPKRHGKAY